MDVAVTVTHALELVMFDVGIEVVAFVILKGGGTE